VAIFANTIFNLLVKIRVCKAQPKRYNVSSFGQAGANGVGSSSHHQSHITITIPLIQNSTAENSDAERRRSKALKALKERLKKPGDDEESLVKSEWINESSEMISGGVGATSTTTVGAATSNVIVATNTNESATELLVAGAAIVTPDQK
jgi:hypothetical protein